MSSCQRKNLRTYSLSLMMVVFFLVFSSHFLCSLAWESDLYAQDIKQESSELKNEVLSPEELNAKSEDLLKGRSLGSGAFLWATLKMLIILALVCVFAVLVLRWFLPRLSGFQTKKGDFLQIIRRFPLEQRKSLYLIRVGKEYHLIGVSEQNINYLVGVSEDQVKNIENEINFISKKQKSSFLELLQGKASENTLSNSKK